MLEKFSDKQLRDWFDRTYLEKARKNGLDIDPIQHGIQSLQIHDCWSLYAYGDVLKVVYFKKLPNRKNPRKDKLFPTEFDLKQKPKITPTPKDENERFSNSVSRSKARIFELAMCNEFTHFCTFTQDEKLRDRFNLAEFRKDFAMFVRNLNRSRDESDKIKYLLIPEQHKDGAWHMHGLLMGLGEKDLRLFTLKEKLPERIRKQLAKGVEVYDWTRYRRSFGYFTCTKINNTTACAKYTTKYISKDLQKSVRESGEHLFFASQGLKGREVVVKQSLDKCPFEKWDFENEFVKVREIQLSDKSDSKKNRPLK